MNHALSPSKIEKFLKDFEEMGTSTILGLMIISVGLYGIHWLYTLNKLLERHDKYAPESKRGLTLLAVLPLSWFFIMFFIKTILIPNSPLLITIFEMITWGCILFLIMKYLIDLSHSFCDITDGHPVIWIALFFFGLIGIAGIFSGQKYFFAFVLCNIFAIVGMQSELNSILKSHTIRKQGNSYYKR